MGRGICRELHEPVDDSISRLGAVGVPVVVKLVGDLIALDGAGAQVQGVRLVLQRESARRKVRGKGNVGVEVNVGIKTFGFVMWSQKEEICRICAADAP